MNRINKIAKRIIGFSGIELSSGDFIEVNSMSIVVTDDDISKKSFIASVKFYNFDNGMPFFSKNDILKCFNEGTVKFAKGDEHFIHKVTNMLQEEYNKYLRGDMSNSDYCLAVNMTKPQAKKMIREIGTSEGEFEYRKSWKAVDENGNCAYSDDYIKNCTWSIPVKINGKTQNIILKEKIYIKFQIDTDKNAMIIISFHKERPL